MGNTAIGSLPLRSGGEHCLREPAGGGGRKRRRGECSKKHTEALPKDIKNVQNFMTTLKHTSTFMHAISIHLYIFISGDQVIMSRFV